MKRSLFVFLFYLVPRVVCAAAPAAEPVQEAQPAAPQSPAPPPQEQAAQGPPQADQPPSAEQIRAAAKAPRPDDLYTKDELKKKARKQFTMKQVMELAEILASQKAETLALFLRPVKEVNWIGFALYTGNSWEIRSTCSLQCPNRLVNGLLDPEAKPSQVLDYGLEAWVPIGAWDIFSRIGGRSWTASLYDQGPRIDGMNAVFGVRFLILGVAGIGAGYDLTVDKWQVATSTPTMGMGGMNMGGMGMGMGMGMMQNPMTLSISTVGITSHRLHVEASGVVRGVNVSAWMKLGEFYGAQADGTPVNSFSVLTGFTLRTPALFSF